ncbi:hypothetical protein [uncultured Methanobrevibacter sp.]|uniref:hypothetical protein n=1 Tax=uncultured Methanobrevibacter sp. TaxID=253161 RepID=UPI0025E41F24|nr:hypothetical protein [uncultured Methanobrevibacter sp.]
MDKKTISAILLIIFLLTIILTVSNIFLQDRNNLENQSGTLTIKNKTVSYDNCGKCVKVIDGNTIQVYGIGAVQLSQIDLKDSDSAKKFVEEKCLGKTVYLNIDNETPKGYCIYRFRRYQSGIT